MMKKRLTIRLAKQLDHAYFEASADTAALNKIMKLYALPGNLGDLAVPKMNEQVEITPAYQNNDGYLTSREISLYIFSSKLCSKSHCNHIKYDQ